MQLMNYTGEVFIQISTCESVTLTIQLILWIFVSLHLLGFGTDSEYFWLPIGVGLAILVPAGAQRTARPTRWICGIDRTDGTYDVRLVRGVFHRVDDWHTNCPWLFKTNERSPQPVRGAFACGERWFSLWHYTNGPKSLTQG